MSVQVPSTSAAVNLPSASEPSSGLVDPAIPPKEPEDGPRPEVDGPVEMTPYRLEMDIESVFYFRHEARARCAVLVRTTFYLKDSMLGEIYLCISMLRSTTNRLF
jgi:hypothetical protein